VAAVAPIAVAIPRMPGRVMGGGGGEDSDGREAVWLMTLRCPHVQLWSVGSFYSSTSGCEDFQLLFSDFFLPTVQRREFIAELNVSSM
jgi:hypothetical protein